MTNLKEMCGLSCCFRKAIGWRGFMPVCEVHKKDIRKFPPSGYSGSIWIHKNPSNPTNGGKI